jgi:23S rRNA (pseudouridine1915-N3)-methyltransferase
VKVVLAVVGKAKGPLAAPILEYEQRVRRYFSFTSVEVKEEPAKQQGGEARVMVEEGKRLLARVPDGAELVALDREGVAWSSERMAAFLSELAVHGRPGAAFLIGGAFGLAGDVLAGAHHRLSLSCFTMPHDLARLVIIEQLYRAGTILRGEPYHKSSRPG